MHQERDLPEEKSKFCKEPVDETYLGAFVMNIILPIAVYLLWAMIYYCILFIIRKKKLKEQQYYTLFTHFKFHIKWSAKILKKAGRKWAPFVFICYHFAFFLISHVFALIAWKSMWAHTGFMFCWLFIMTWNGANYYVKFFKYTQKLTT